MGAWSCLVWTRPLLSAGIVLRPVAAVDNTVRVGFAGAAARR